MCVRQYYILYDVPVTRDGGWWWCAREFVAPRVRPTRRVQYYMDVSTIVFGTVCHEIPIGSI